jgi:hypothetical protein
MWCSIQAPKKLFNTIPLMSSIACYSCIFAFLHRLRMITSSRHTPQMSHNLSRSLLSISDHFRSFLVISDNFYFWPRSGACCGAQFSTPQHPRSSVHNCREHRHVGISKVQGHVSIPLRPDIGPWSRKHATGVMSQIW